ncbi:GtrA family protein [Streptomyces sp. PSKA01]|uniref:GtrA family protein n=2 Tax=Streptomyces cupreus TaxID=2759956 RepID=A0A7X1JAY9_9ACTN|nr:GtrA family protein [Streptomyces cupreus]MBC2907438.1 GtrA family protein [Streptomyces cupreus]
MKSPHSPKPQAATLGGPGPLASFIRFVILGGGTGVLASFAVPLLANALPWAAANAIITVATTLLCTELHARYTFTQHRSATWREHWQAAGSATAACLSTSLAIWALHQIHPSPGMLTEQTVYLTASALAGTARFLILRLYVFTSRRAHSARPLTHQQTTTAPVLAA